MIDRQTIFLVLWSGESGGVQNYVESLAKYIQKRHPRLTPHVVFLTKGDACCKRLRQADIRVEEMHFSTGYDIVAICRLVVFLRKQDAQTIHVHGATPYATSLFRYAIPKARIIHTMHYSLFGGNVFRKALEKHNFKQATVATFVSPGQRNLYGVSYGIDTASSPVIPFGFNFSSSQNIVGQVRDLRQKYGIEEEDLVVGYIGYFVRFKGIHKLIQAVANAVTQIPRIKLIIIGHGPEKASLQTEADRLGVSNITKFYTNPPGVRELQQCMDIVVHPSEHESLCISVLEAMTLGKVVVVNDFKSASFIIDDGVNGIILPDLSVSLLATTLIRLAQSPDLRAQMGKLARIRVRKNFDQEKLFSRFLPLYDKDD